MFITLILIVIIAIFYFWEYIRAYYYIMKIPGPPSWPIVGNSFQLHDKDFVTAASKLHEKYGSFKIWVGPIPLLLIDDPDDIQTLFTNKSYTKPSWIVQHLLTNSSYTILPLSTGLKWKNKRKVISSGLTSSIVNTFLPTFNRISDILVEQLKTEARKQEVFPVARYFGHATFDSIFETTLNVESTAQTTGSKFLQADKSDFRVIVGRYMRIWLQLDFIFKRSSLAEIHHKNLKIKRDIITKVMDKWRMRKDGEIFYENGRKPIIHYFMELLETFEDISFQELRDEIIFMIAAGYATTAVALSFALVVLGAHQDVQQKVYEELHAVFGDSDRPVDVTDLDQLKYLQMFIQESLRMFPSIPYIQRRTADDIQLKHFKIPRNTELLISIFQTHRNAKFWNEPYKFDPERFNPDNNDVKSRHRYAFIPYGVGSHICPGNKYAMVLLKVILAKILRKYKIHTELKMDELKLTFDFTLRLLGGQLITITSRN